VSENTSRSNSVAATADGFDVDELESEENPMQRATPLTITGAQSIRTAGELHKTLADYLNRGLAVVVDMSMLDECDTAALQLVYALRQSAVQRKQRFEVTAVSPAMIETAAALGLRIGELTTPWEPTAPDGLCEATGKDNGI
jgi:anti-anti-sigma regulatory factor